MKLSQMRLIHASMTKCTCHVWCECVCVCSDGGGAVICFGLECPKMNGKCQNIFRFTYVDFTLIVAFCYQRQIVIKCHTEQTTRCQFILKMHCLSQGNTFHCLNQTMSYGLQVERVLHCPRLPPPGHPGLCSLKSFQYSTPHSPCARPASCPLQLGDQNSANLMQREAIGQNTTIDQKVPLTNSCLLASVSLSAKWIK